MIYYISMECSRKDNYLEKMTYYLGGKGQLRSDVNLMDPYIDVWQQYL